MNTIEKKTCWLGQIVPKLRTDIANLYWTTDIPTTEISETYGLPISSICREAGEGIVKGFPCRECGFRITVISRTEAADRIARTSERRGDLTGLAYWAEPDLCRACSKKIRDAENSVHIEAHRSRMRRQSELASMPYREYLQTPEWQRTRNDALKRAKFRCQTCSRKGELHVHHRTYARRGSEWTSDLIVLCASCHSLFHQNSRLAENGRAA